MAAGLPDAESKLDSYLTAEKTNWVNSAFGTGVQSSLEANKAQAEADKIHEEAKQEAKQTAQKGFEAQINAILSGGDSAPVHKIIVVQSVDDKLPLGDVFNTDFPKDNGPKPITVHDVKLGGISDMPIVGGIAGHVDILTYAEKNIINSPAAAVAGASAGIVTLQPINQQPNFAATAAQGSETALLRHQVFRKAYS